MAYSDFTLQRVEKELGVVSQFPNLFPNLTTLPLSAWLQETLARGMELALVSEKARSEFIVAPILLTCRELSQKRVTIYSGERLDVDPKLGLVGECDFILARTEPAPFLRAPLATIVEAKKNDIEVGLGQCAAQMVGARLFNENEGRRGTTIFGCVTTSEAWQFLKLEGPALLIDHKRYYLSQVGLILAAFQTMFAAVP